MTAATASTANGSTIHFRLDDELLGTISEQAHQARPGRTALSIIGGLLFTLGWVTAKTFRVLFYSGAWAWYATAVGWRQARGEPPRGPSLEQVLRENDALRKELSRLTPTMS